MQNLNNENLENQEVYDDDFYECSEIEEDLYNLAIDHFEKGNILDSRKYFSYLTDMDPENDHYWFMSAMCSYNLNDYVESIADFNKSISINPLNHEYHFFKAWSLHLCGQNEDALDSAMKSYELNQDSDSLYLETLILYELKEYESSLKLLNILLEHMEEDDILYVDILFKKSTVLVASGDYESALEVIDKAIEYKPKSIQLVNFKGVIFDLLGRYDEALDLFNEAKSIDKNWPIPHLNIAKIFFNKKEFLEALNLIEKVIVMDNDFDEAWYYKALIHFMLSDNDSAMEAIDTALDLNFAKPEYFLLKSQILEDLGLIEESDNYKRLIESELNLINF